jgi:hypothetical protein
VIQLAALAIKRRNVMTDVVNAKSEVLERHELSLEELEAVSGGDVSVSLFGHKITSSDVADAAKWVWNKLF